MKPRICVQLSGKVARFCVIFTSGICLLFPVFVNNAVASDHEIYGYWYDKSKKLLVEIHACAASDFLCGTIVVLGDGQENIDKNNPDVSLRHRPLIGLQIIQGFSKADDNRWFGGGKYGKLPGRIYLPTNGDTLGDHKNSYEIVLVDSNQVLVQKKGCSFCLFRQVWIRSSVKAIP